MPGSRAGKGTWKQRLREGLESFLDRELQGLGDNLDQCLDSLMWAPETFEKAMDLGVGQELDILRLYQSLDGPEPRAIPLARALDRALEEAALRSPVPLRFLYRVSSGSVDLPERPVEACLAPVLGDLFLGLALRLEEGGSFFLGLREAPEGPVLEIVLDGVLEAGAYRERVPPLSDRVVPLILATFGLSFPEAAAFGEACCRFELPLPASAFLEEGASR